VAPGPAVPLRAAPAPESPPRGPAKRGDPVGTSGAYSTQERRVLLDLARETLNAQTVGKDLPAPSPARLTDPLRQPKGCFVTLTKGGRLRGCIGYIFPQGPLYQAVIDNTRNAAVNDARFRPLQADELDQVRIEISVLSVPQPLAFSSSEDLLAKLTPHRDGVVLQMGKFQATYLPQVWEQIPRKEQFLEQLSTKAGCLPWSWKLPGTQVLTYQAEAFQEAQE
jgi:AmmeMemoRadiSam system protein A